MTDFRPSLIGYRMQAQTCAGFKHIKLSPEALQDIARAVPLVHVQTAPAALAFLQLMNRLQGGNSGAENPPK